MPKSSGECAIFPGRISRLEDDLDLVPSLTRVLATVDPFLGDGQMTGRPEAWIRHSAFLMAHFLVLSILGRYIGSGMSAFVKLWFGFAAVILSAGWILLPGAEPASDSPFLPPDSDKSAPPSVPAPTLANLQFASVLSFGREVLISVFDVQTNEGVWIPVGGEADGIRVITYDPENEEVTVLSAGVTARLKLREAQFTGGGLIRPLPTLEQEYGRPLTVEEQETEARMLVSDLLEIGMQERARQRELRRKEILKQRRK